MQLISVTEAASRLGVSRGHIYNLIAAGQLRRHDVGLKRSKTRLSNEDVERYIRESEKPVGAA